MQASEMTIQDLDHLPSQIYVLIRVWDARSTDTQCEAFPDPYSMLYKRGLEIVADVSVALQE